MKIRKTFSEEVINLEIITNNPLVKEKLLQKAERPDRVKNITFLSDCDYIGVLHNVRNLVHSGYKILTHPLYGSVKPNETPYRTIFVEPGTGLDMDSLKLIESAIQTVETFQKNYKTPVWDEKVTDDFQVVDLDLIAHTLNGIKF
ncbi:glycine reductase complex protein GrdX [Peptoclostridium acidaminophilum DSM 3953]|uniref:Glycine reductase complex protein GrdX n=1 Tax=Peptoclostridium acidaminophilum DSM 3953 TaxID=1286171 RepID=W8TGN6_PEPAC|nr:glycine reductase complex protein GrdX [Peptoclostridium acidaminophilum DSM 3953]